jgi:hypothetical protein
MEGAKVSCRVHGNPGDLEFLLHHGNLCVKKFVAFGDYYNDLITTGINTGDYPFMLVR